MKIGLISAVRFSESSQRAIPTLGLYYLASYMNKYKPEVEVKVYVRPEELIEDKPDVAGISTVTENVKVALEWAAMFREKLDVPILIGGDHISSLPHTLPEVFDIGVIGEGEETLLKLVKLMMKNNNWRKKLDTIPGLCFHEDGQVVINRKRNMITPITRIPYPLRDPKVWAGFHYLLTSRGCPYHCTFCSPNTVWHKYRTFPANYVIGELDEVFRNFKPYYIHFFDDLFIGDRERVKEISSLVRRRGYDRLVSFGGHIRADMMDDELCQDLRRMNFISGAFGAESGSDKILKFLKAGSTTVEMNQKAIEICVRNGIQLNLSFIIGTPGETKEDLDKTLEFIERNRHNMMGIEVFVVMPYPGTPLWTWCRKRDIVSEDMDWDLFRSKAFFSEMEINDDILYFNDSMDFETFKEYAGKFQKIDAEMNRNNLKIYETIEENVKLSNARKVLGS